MSDTPARLLKLLSLLQTPREWPGGELAERLDVSPRTIRRDIDRLRDLGYPVEASRGSIGGYRLVAGAAMPPLLLDDEEAVAIAVGLRAGAGHAIEGVDEASVRALAKLEQVLPSRLRHRVSVLQNATVPLTRGDGSTIDPRTLTTLASAATGRERLRFAYRSGDGTRTKRQVEPYRLVSTGQRWYLVAYDIDREDWRTFRVDRVGEPYATGARFAPRPLPVEGAGSDAGGGTGSGDAATFLARSMRRMQPELRLDVWFGAPAEFVAARLPAHLGAPEPDGEGGCRLRASCTDSLEWVALRLALVDCEFSVQGPPQLVAYLESLGARLTRAAAGAGPQPRQGPGPEQGERGEQG
ncbi:transcriptional regulator [Streptomyces filamentosus]|uniref:Transcriptional regulator n=2 Tax=Streptomyces filamentosus TaxID=67294 RepID=A0ABY4UYX5_STRFL|nr:MULTISPECIES: transcriptional regulator [Streptomyces]EFE75301.1 DeoR-family transcriptional regulator [Streptomyces filamentosus NRRL 15998]EWS92354.1 DeoR family transcriptional regulator [Streptomyces filamentosus NRRL 11379]MYR79372.1 WYL domain-containing protein [Streptomyces sp. SID5466]USC49052.1 transcriptional regulator [Streptomyces filamentosus]